MASDVLGIQLAWLIENQIPQPIASSINDISIDKNTQFVTLVNVNLMDYLQDTSADKKRLKSLIGLMLERQKRVWISLRL